MKNNSTPTLLRGAAPEVAPPAIPVWRASIRMALVTTAGLIAAGLMTTGLTGCADMSGIQLQSPTCHLTLLDV